MKKNLIISYFFLLFTLGSFSLVYSAGGGEIIYTCDDVISPLIRYLETKGPGQSYVFQKFISAQFLDAPSKDKPWKDKIDEMFGSDPNKKPIYDRFRTRVVTSIERMKEAWIFHGEYKCENITRRVRICESSLKGESCRTEDKILGFNADLAAVFIQQFNRLIKPNIFENKIIFRADADTTVERLNFRVEEGVMNLSLVKRGNSFDSRRISGSSTEAILLFSVIDKREWEEKNLIQKAKHVELDTDALADNGLIGDGYLHRSASEKGPFKFLLILLLGILGTIYMPVLATLVSLEIATVVSTVAGLAGIIGTIVTLSVVLTVEGIWTGKTFGTVSQPAGGLEQFGWNWHDPFPTGGNCNLSALPISGAPPLTVRFSIDIRNGTFAGWNGPCDLSSGSCYYTYDKEGTYGPYTAYVSGVAGRKSCESPTIRVYQPPFDLYISDLKVNTTICKDTQKVSNINEYGVRYPDNRFPPVAGTQVTSVPEANCPETQINRPVDVSFKVNCRELEPGGCQRVVDPYIIQVNFYGDNSNPNATFTPRSDPITFNGPRYITQEINWQRNRAYYQTGILDYIPTTTINFYSHYFQRPAGTTTVQVCLLNEGEAIYTDADNLNNCAKKTIRVYNYYCLFGFCSQGVYDPQRDPLYKDQFPYRHDNHCRYWRNNICRAMIR